MVSAGLWLRRTLTEIPMLKKLRRAWTRLTNPSKAFVDDVFDEVDLLKPPTREEQLKQRQMLEGMGYDVSQLPPVKDYHG